MPASPAASEPDFGGNDVGSIDFEVDAGDQPRDVSGLGISMDQSKDDESTLQRSDLGSLEISGLDDESEVPKKRKAKEVGPKRMKKRRKIVIDTWSQGRRAVWSCCRRAKKKPKLKMSKRLVLSSVIVLTETVFRWKKTM